MKIKQYAPLIVIVLFSVFWQGEFCSAFSVNYTYDNLGRLTQVVQSANDVTTTISYAYDAAGNLLNSTVVREGPVVLSFTAGMNLFVSPVELSPGTTTFDLLAMLGTDTEVGSLQCLNPVTQTWGVTEYENGVITGDEFEIATGAGCYVQMNQAKTVILTGLSIPSTLQFVEGANLMSLQSVTSGYTSYDLLLHLGTPEEVSSIQRFNPESGAFETTAYYNGQPVGVEFPVNPGEAYIVNMVTGKSTAGP